MYQLNPSVSLSSDVDEFVRLYHAGRRATDSTTIAFYEQACKLYLGPFLQDDLYADWSSVRREQLRSIYLVMCKVLADYYTETGNYEEAIPWATAMLKENACDEDYNPYSNPEMEADRFFPLIAKAAKLVLPQAKRLAMRVGRNILSRMRQPSSGRNQQIAALLRQLQQVLAQGESEAATHEAAHHAALTEVMAAEASYTESESEAQALLGAALPIPNLNLRTRSAIITPTVLRSRNLRPSQIDSWEISSVAS